MLLVGANDLDLYFSDEMVLISGQFYGKTLVASNVLKKIS